MTFLTLSDPAWFTLGGTNSTFETTGYIPGKMNDHIQVQVFPEWYKQITLQWSIPPSWGNCTFNVFYQETEEKSSTVKLNYEPLSSPSFSDTRSKEYSKFRTGIYTVEVILPSGSSVRSFPASWGVKRRDRLERIAIEVQRREFLLLSKFSGIKSFVFRRRMYGAHCSRCWNQEQEKVMDDHCTVCFGTSFEGGYFDPIPVYIQYDPTPNNRVHTPSGRYEANTMNGWTISIPEVSPEDVIIRGGDFNVYRVIANLPTELQAKPVRQILTLTQLGKKDIENALTRRIQDDRAHEYLAEFGKRSETRFPVKNLDLNRQNDFAWNNQKETHDLPRNSVAPADLSGPANSGGYVI